jgi:hypothetical protein
LRAKQFSSDLDGKRLTHLRIRSGEKMGWPFAAIYSTTKRLDCGAEMGQQVSKRLLKGFSGLETARCSVIASNICGWLFPDGKNFLRLDRV